MTSRHHACATLCPTGNVHTVIHSCPSSGAGERQQEATRPCSCFSQSFPEAQVSFPSRTAAGSPDPGASLVGPTAHRAVSGGAGRRGTEPDQSPPGSEGSFRSPSGLGRGSRGNPVPGRQARQRREATGMSFSVCSRTRPERDSDPTRTLATPRPASHPRRTAAIEYMCASVSGRVCVCVCARGSEAGLGQVPVTPCLSFFIFKTGITLPTAKGYHEIEMCSCL